MAEGEVTISELELADEVLGDMVLAVDTTSDTKSVSLRQLKAWLGSSLPTGFIVASLGKMNDDRFTLLDGKTFARDGTYQAFCNKVIEQVQAGNWYACTASQYEDDLTNKGQCDKFVITNDYVRIPKLGNKLYSGVINGTIPVFGNDMTLGITDGTNNYGWMYSTPGGNQANSEKQALYGTNVGSTSSSTGFPTSGKSLGITTDPTKSGIEASVENLNGDVTVYYYMVVSTDGQTSPVEIDINAVYEDLELKANKDLSNVANVASTFKEASVGWGVPDYTAGVSQSADTEYTAPSDGWIYCYNWSRTTSYVSINGVEFTMQTGNGNAVYVGAGLICFIKKGDVYKTNSSVYLRFYPCRGAI